MQLEELLGAELFAQVQTKINEHNEMEPDRQKHVRFVDLSESVKNPRRRIAPLRVSMTGAACGIAAGPHRSAHQFIQNV